MRVLSQILFVTIITVSLSGRAVSTISTETPPKYSEVKRMSYPEVNEALKEFIGVQDTWRTDTSLVTKVTNLNPFKKKTTIQEEVAALSKSYQKDSPQALQMVAIQMTRSQHEEIKNMVSVIQGDKRMTLNSYKFNRDHELKAILYFFRNLQYGDTGTESRKFFSEFAFAFNNLAHQLKMATDRAEKLNIPMIIEFESSALIDKSPLTRLLFNTIVSDSSHVLKAEVTPNGGRIISVNPLYARAIVQNIELFASEFKKSIALLKNSAFSDRNEAVRDDSKQRLIDLLRYGEGVSGLLYTEERIQEIAQEKLKQTPKTCKGFFGRFGIGK